jgi:hypothetical protein
MISGIKNEKFLSIMDEELENFDKQITEKGHGKLIIDFDISDLQLQKSEFVIGEIQYKKAKKRLSQSTINIKDKLQTTQNLF